MGEGGGRKGWKVRAPPPMPHLSHLEIIIHHASPATGECVVLFNGCHWHNSSSLPPTACHQIATLAAGIHFLAPVRRCDVYILACKKFCLMGKKKRGWFLWVYRREKLHRGAYSHFCQFSTDQMSVKCRVVLKFGVHFIIHHHNSLTEVSIF